MRDMEIQPVNIQELSKEELILMKIQMAIPIIMMPWMPKLKLNTQLSRNTESNKWTSKERKTNGEMVSLQTLAQWLQSIPYDLPSGYNILSIP